jgi:hypothetical protein
MMNINAGTDLSSNYAGYIYILSNKAFRQNLFKIGLTKRTAADRAYEIYVGATGVPARFEVKYTYPVSDCWAAEARVHTILDKYRFNDDREFFQVEFSLASDAIKTVCDEINREKKISPPPKLDEMEWVLISNSSGEYDQESIEEPNKTIIVHQSIDTAAADEKIIEKAEILSNSPKQNVAVDAENLESKEYTNHQNEMDWMTVIFVIGVGGGGNIFMALTTAMKAGEFGLLNAIFLGIGFACLFFGFRNMRN